MINFIDEKKKKKICSREVGKGKLRNKYNLELVILLCNEDYRSFFYVGEKYKCGYSYFLF